VDLDAFYASVEQRHDPSLAGLPVIVGADPREGFGRGVVLSASYEARRFGVRSAMPARQAASLCPQARWVWPHHERYAEASDRVFALLRSERVTLEPASIDEAYIDITKSVQGFEEAVDHARALKAKVRAAEGLTVSVGVATNKLVAKIASDAAKPDGLTPVRPGEEASFLAQRQVRAIPGVGPKTESALVAAGIERCADLASAPLDLLRSLVGSWAPTLRAHALGIDDSPVLVDWERRSLGSETTFDVDEEDRAAILRTIEELAAGAAESLRSEGLLCRTVGIKVRNQDFSTFTRARTLPGPTAETASIQAVAARLFRENDAGEKIRLIGVRLSGLVQGGQASIDRWSADALGEAPRWEPRFRF
jgi:nucleotidyltransferase/DNA polymerase involved in DNA repair